MLPNSPDDRKKRSPSSLGVTVIVGISLLALAGVLLILLNLKKPAQNEAEMEDYVPMVPRQVDFPAPELALKDMNDQPVSLDDYDGQVVLVNNWAFWCTPCRAELPTLEEYYKDQHEKGFVIVGIEAGSEKEDVAYHVDLFKLTFPVWLDPDKLALKAFGNFGLPNSYLIDRQGTVRLAWTGPINRELLDQYISPIIEE